MKNKKMEENNQKICANCGHHKSFHFPECIYGLVSKKEGIERLHQCKCKKFIPKNNHSSKEQNMVESPIAKENAPANMPEDMPDEDPDKDSGKEPDANGDVLDKSKLGSRNPSGSETLSDKIYTWKEGYLDRGEFFKLEDVRDFINKVLFEDIPYVISDVEKRIELQKRIKIRAGDLE